MQLNQAYNALGLPWAASKTDVRRAYRRLIKAWHPDRNPHPSAASIAARLNIAYAALSEEDGDAASASGRDATDSGRPFPISRKAPRRSRPAFHNLFLSVEQGASGGIFEFVARTSDICHTCDGYTTVTTEFPCEACSDAEMDSDSQANSHDGLFCPECQGTRRVLIRCEDCEGTGLGQPADFRFKAIIPKGVRGGELYRLRAVGKCSGDARFAAEAILRVHLLKHTVFAFDSLGRLLVTVASPETDGQRVLVPTLLGSKPLRVPSVKVKQALVKGYGYPSVDGTPGDLVVQFG